jgi:hypothetical protein
LDVVPDDEEMNNLKEDILLEQSNEVLRQAENLLGNNPYDVVEADFNRLLAKAERIYPENPNILSIRKKAIDKLYMEVGEMICERLVKGDYKGAKEWAEELIREDPENPYVQAIYKVVKKNSPHGRWWY